MVQKAEKTCAESESNKAKAEAKYGLKGLLLHFAHTLNKKRRGISSKVTTRRQGYSVGDSERLGGRSTSRAWRRLLVLVSRACFKELCVNYFRNSLDVGETWLRNISNERKNRHDWRLREARPESQEYNP